ncbi:hypothetical protein [uncultured Corynebacterium sp.]|uniref:hypothetical protein n=1 Tax=uncultured Corynebacterium sp. TaxID=159447 RepID=UPI0025D47BF8|nr:hypothetical protein [uncultured Corynebacterium sp.]
MPGLVGAASAAIPDMPQGYPIANLYQKCEQHQATAEGYPDWHYGETARRYLSDGTIQFTNTTKQTVKYTAKVESGTNHEIVANSAAKMPSGWNTTAKTDIGLTLSNGWINGETIGPIELGPGESFRVEYGTVEKDFIAMFVDCREGFYQNIPGANVIRGTGPAERYAWASIIRADGSVDDQALEIPSRAPGANSKVVDGGYSATSGPSLEKIADPEVDTPVTPSTELNRENWPAQGDTCTAGDIAWYPNTIEGVAPTFRKPGYSQDFLNWTDADYTYKGVTDHLVGAQYNGQLNWQGNHGRLPEGWLGSIGAAQRAYMPVGTALAPLDLKPGERARIEYGTTMMRVNYSELHCGKDGTYSLVHNFKQASAPAGFWAEATVTAQDGTKRTVDVTPEEWKSLPVPTQAAL